MNGIKNAFDIYKYYKKNFESIDEFERHMEDDHNFCNIAEKMNYSFKEYSKNEISDMIWEELTNAIDRNENMSW
jgi:hypothetical protein